MRSSLSGSMVGTSRIRAGFIGCGSHACRNLFPAFAFTDVELRAVCDVDRPRAAEAARRFGAAAVYTDHREMLDAEQLDAVFVCTNYDENGRPRYPKLSADALAAGCHAWIEKPPAASCREIDALAAAAEDADRTVMVGLKKMFAPANARAASLAGEDGFGPVSLVTAQYPQAIPPAEAIAAYLADPTPGPVVSFLDHLCHPLSVLALLLGEPATLFYRRSPAGNGTAVLEYQSGAVASLALTAGAVANGGMERTMILGSGGCHITVENNIRLSLHRAPSHKYGRSPDYFTGGSEDVSAVWEPEFSLGQLYNKGLFLLGYYDEIAEFVSAVRDGREPTRGTLAQARHITRTFEAFAEGPGKVIEL